MQLSPFRIIPMLAFSTFITACSTPTKPAQTTKSKATIAHHQKAKPVKKIKLKTPKKPPAKKQTPPIPRHIRKPQPTIFLAEGTASYYGKRFQGRKTASGEPFDMHQLTAAHKKLPFGSKVLVTNLGNNRSVVVTINDRGPYSKNRIIDLSKAAAKRIGMIQAGVVKVKVEVLL